MVIEGTGLQSLPGHRDKSSQERQRLSGGAAQEVGRRGCGSIQPFEQKNKHEPDDGRSHNGFKLLKGYLLPCHIRLLNGELLSSTCMSNEE